ncbi:MAG TPA: OsmC family protein [Actinomycetes bacterium]|nr:OsmC family protein [Actinomycetes bacterium]
MPNLSVTHQAADQFQLQVRGHRLRCDQPLAAGGTDQGPTPTELFVGSLAACAAFYARRFLARHDLDATGLRVEAAYTMSRDRPARVDTITLRLLLPGPLAEHRRRALLAVVEHCTVHNSLRTPPEVRVTLAAAARPSPPPFATVGR